MVWYDMEWHDMAWYEMAWHGMVWYGIVGYNMIWYSMVWYGIWYSMVWFGMVCLVHLTRPNATKILVGADGHGSEVQTNGVLLHSFILVSLFYTWDFSDFTFFKFSLSLWIAFTGHDIEAQTNGGSSTFLSERDLFKLVTKLSIKPRNWDFSRF